MEMCVSSAMSLMSAKGTNKNRGNASSSSFSFADAVR